MSTSEGGGLRHRVVVGVGGTGKTTRLAEWQAESPAPIGRITGRLARPVDLAHLDRVLASGIRALIVDDLHWVADDVVEALIATADEIVLWVAARPHPQTEAVSALIDRLTETVPAERLGMLGLEPFGVRLAQLLGRPANNTLVEIAYEWTAGSPALLADVVAHGDLALLGEEDAHLPRELVDEVVGRVRRSGPASLALSQLLAFDDELPIDLAIQALATTDDKSFAERSLRGSGVLGLGNRLIPIVASCVAADLTTDDRRRLRESVVGVLASADPVAAARHHRGDDTVRPAVMIAAASALCDVDPADANGILDRLSLDTVEASDLRPLALLSLRLGRPDLNDIVERGLVLAPAEFDDLALVREFRFLRWPLAADRQPTTNEGRQLKRLADVLVGVPAGHDGDDSFVSGLVAALAFVREGDASLGFSRLTGLADDFRSSDRLATGIGVTAHSLGALVGLLLGDHEGAAALLDEARADDLGGPSEQGAAAAVAAFARMRLGDYSEAVDLVKTSPPAGDFRLRLLHAAVNAGLARRSGDTARMRHAWVEADAVLSRPTVSWLFVDVLGELVLVGAKLGNDRRVDDVMAELEAQVGDQGSNGPIALSVRWLRFQLAIQRDDRAAIENEAGLLAAMGTQDRRSSARISAAPLWIEAIDGTCDVGQLIDAASELALCGDSWEGSRLLGRAALDHPDAGAARRLLDAARGLSVDLADAESGDGLMARGLSEREAEVAQLVAGGKTYKEIGAQLYISPKTVEHHVARARQKLGATSRAEFLAAVSAAADE